MDYSSIPQDDVSSLRVRYSILVNYISRSIRFISSLVSSVILVRKISVEEYGLLGIMLSTYSIIVYAYSIWDWWIYRYYARKMYKYSSAAFFMNIVYSFIAIPTYMVIGYYYSNLLGFGFSAFVLMSIVVGISAIQIYLQYISRATRPYLLGYSMTISELIRAIMIYTFVYIFRLGIHGAVYSLVISRISAVLTYVFYLHFKEKIYIPPPKFYINEIKILMKNMYVQIVSYISNLIMQFERHIVTLLSGATDLSAYLTVSYIPRNIILGNTMAFTASLTSRLLRGKSRIDVEDALRMAIIINTFNLSIFLSFASPIISLLNPVYIYAYPLFTLYSIEAYIMSINHIFFSVMTGTDKSDLAKNGLGLIRSNIFVVTFLGIIRNISAIGLGTGWFIYSLLVLKMTTILCLILYPIGWIITAIIIGLYTYKKSKKIIPFNLPAREILSSIIGMLGIISYSLITGAFSYTGEEFWPLTYFIVQKVIISAMIYATLTITISPWTRLMLKKIIA